MDGIKIQLFNILNNYTKLYNNFSRESLEMDHLIICSKLPGFQKDLIRREMLKKIMKEGTFA